MLAQSLFLEVAVLCAVEVRAANIQQRRLKDIISTLSSSHVYLVLECLDCDLRSYLDTCSDASSLPKIKVCASNPLSATGTRK